VFVDLPSDRTYTIRRDRAFQDYREGIMDLLRGKTAPALVS
jgi:NitT/TauT family transport system ATP-binding protein